MLAKFALALHNSTHSEANVERLFKSLSRTLIKLRSRLGEDVVDAIVFLATNLPLVRKGAFERAE